MPTLTILQLNRKLTDLSNEVRDLKIRLGVYTLPVKANNEKLQRYIEIVEKYYGLPEGAILSKCQKMPIPEARMMVLLKAVEFSGTNKFEVCRDLNLAEPAYNYAKRTILGRLPIDRNLREKMDEINELLK